MSGRPEAELTFGDPERLKLLDAIPLDKLDPSRRFSHCLTMARHTMYVGREIDDANDRESHIRAAVHVADQQQTRLWQVVTRLDLASFTKRNRYRDEAKQLATTAALHQLTADYVPAY